MIKTNNITVVIEDIYQVHNASSIVRTCEGFDLKDIHVIEKKYKFDFDTEKTLGAEKNINIHYYKDSLECINFLKKQGYKIVSTTLHEDNFDLETFPIQDKIALVFGTERKGITKELIDESDMFIKIPMYGFTESFNISVSVAICLNFFINSKL